MGHRGARLLAAMLVAVSAFQLVAAVHNEGPDGVETGYVAGVDVPVSELLIFPYCVCDDYRCSSSPYELKMQPVRTVTDDKFGQAYEFCFIMKPTPCTGTCCDMIKANVGKVEFELDKACEPSYIAAYVNGTWQTSYYDTVFSTGKIRITSLDYGPEIAPDTEYCMRFQWGVPTCPCISAPIKESSRWRLGFDDAVSEAVNTTFTFDINLVAAAECWPVSYRNGDCCAQTLDSIALSTIPIYGNAIIDAYVTTDKGEKIKTVVIKGDWGTEFYPVELCRDCPNNMFYITNFTVGVPWKFTVVFDSNLYSNTTTWPCQTSAFTPWEPGNCDYMMSGLQTEVGQPTVVLTGPSDAGCCPEGLIPFYSSKKDNCCVDNYAEVRASGARAAAHACTAN
ncbi:hypothetical protein FOA52_013412 [Chlamydomonas sp. UWO 241]|nr:hypothetical protein FOA52_013412 [Chlamydomonas sp. UWO 241]